MKKLSFCGVLVMNVTLGLTLTSSDIQNNQIMPKQFTGEGADTAPRLEWSNVPAKTKSLVLICDDPDAQDGPWVHWVVYNIPPTVKNLNHVKKDDEKTADGTMQGLNSWEEAEGNLGYKGPLPPAGSGVHHYHFKLYALDTKLNLKPRATKAHVEAAMKGHILAQAELVGLYEIK